VIFLGSKVILTDSACAVVPVLTVSYCTVSLSPPEYRTRHWSRPDVLIHALHAPKTPAGKDGDSNVASCGSSIAGAGMAARL